MNIEIHDNWYEIKQCEYCGKKFTVLQSEIWAYKKLHYRKGKKYTFWCSWKCLRASEKEEETKQMEKEAIRKRPGRKPKAATVSVAEKLPEEARAEERQAEMEIKEERGRRIAERLDMADRARREMIDGIEALRPVALASRVIPDAIFTKQDGEMTLVNEKARITLTAYEWFKLTEEILVAIRQLDVTPAEIDDDLS